jgi:hypothetical protein
MTHGVALWVRFDEATNTLSLFDPKRNAFVQTGTPGGGTLSNHFVKLHLKASRITAAGPRAPTVTITLDLSFRKPARGRHFTVAAAARDDLGRAGDFAFAGTLDVRR